MTLLPGAGSTSRAQQTIFNVPSPDILGRRAAYLEADQYGRWWAAEDAAFLLVRGVFGLGHDVEVGFNLGPFDYLDDDVTFLDATVKWRPWLHPFRSERSVGLIVGTNSGIGLRDGVAGELRSLLYGASFLDLSGIGTRFSAGAYAATRHVFTDEGRSGLQVTLEQHVPGVDGLTVAADWFSGGGAALTTGLIWTRGRYVVYAGYGFANDGREADLLTLELGVTLGSRVRGPTPGTGATQGVAPE